MTVPISAPRKQRTWQHVIADLAVHYFEGFLLESGHTGQRLGSDYGYDLIAWTFDERGYIEPGSILIQIKAAENLVAHGTNFVFDLDIRDYNLWVREEMPVILVLFDATRRRAYWLAIQQYFNAARARLPKKGAKWVRVRVPRRNAVSQGAVAKIQSLKADSLDRG